MTDADRSGLTTAGQAAASPLLVERVRAEVTERLGARVRAAQQAGTPLSAADRDRLVDELIGEVLTERARQALAQGRPTPDEATRRQVAAAARAGLLGLGPFDGLLADPRIENINANGCDNVWVRYAGGHAERVDPVASSDDELVAWVRQVVADTGGQERRFDRGSPSVDAQLPDGSRLKAVMAVGRRVYVSLRRFRYRDASLESLQATGTLDAGLRAFLTAAVAARLNILIAGGTFVGKTTFLRALAHAIGERERLITIEDAFELNLDAGHAEAGHPDVVALQARPANTEGVGEVTLAELVRWALRMSPDRVIVGEVRGAEVVPMLNAMSQGCDGSMATVHASSSAQALLKLASYAVQAAERLPFESTGLLIASGVHLVVHLDYATDTPTSTSTATGTGTTAGTGVRVVSSVREVVDADGPRVVSNEIYRPGEDRRARPVAGALSAALRERLCRAGMDARVLDNPDGWWPL
jgi:pilus assembly protein CpaF